MGRPRPFFLAQSEAKAKAGPAPGTLGGILPYLYPDPMKAQVSSKRTPRARVFAACLLALLVASAREAAGTGRKEIAGLAPISIPPVGDPPVIDGNLDDAIWATASRFDGFKTFKPDYGKEPSQRTEAFIAYDPESFYFAFRCWDTEPSRIKATVAKRDAVFQDDLVFVLLDTFNDNQNCFTLVVNPLGIQGDGITSVQGSMDPSHDLVWYSAGRVDEGGWTVEARIPLQSLRFPDGATLTMRAVFIRFLTRTSEQFSYPALDPENSNIMAQAQPIRVTGLRYKRVRELIPAFTYGSRREARDGALRKTEEYRDLGLTAKLGLTSDLTLDAAYNPDFSQVEADAGQVDVNLRYALYYPEKRPFFLEGKDIWDFGGTTQDAPLQAVVYTRTIVDPVYGFRLTGKLGRRDTVAAIYARDDLPGDGRGEHPVFSIFRYKHALRADSYLGGFYTGREQGAGHNRVGGLDGRLRLTRNWVLSFHAFGSLTRREPEGPSRRDHALALSFNHQSRSWYVEAGYQDVSRDFQVDSGFLTRTGLRRLALSVTRVIYPRSPVFLKIEPLYQGSQVYDTIFDMWETSNVLALRFSLPRSTEVRLEAIAGNEIFAGRRFERTGYGARANSQVLKEVFFDASFRRSGGIFYDPAAPYQGDETRTGLTVSYQPHEKLDFVLNLASARFKRRSDGAPVYDYTILHSRNTFQVNRYLFLRAILEYNVYRKRLTADGLVSFTYIPGTVFYVGYGSAYERLEWRNGAYAAGRRFLETKRGLFLKISYLWRF